MSITNNLACSDQRVGALQEAIVSTTSNSLQLAVEMLPKHTVQMLTLLHQRQRTTPPPPVQRHS